jgi:hypothetical protein
VRGVKLGTAIASTALLAAVAASASCYMQDRKLERGFNKITIGMPEQQIVALMGKPYSTGTCGRLGGFPKGCSKEYLYSTPYPIVPWTWAIFVDAHGRVIDKYVYQSP